MAERLLFYLLIWPLSRLPFWAINGLGSFLGFVLKHIGYRKSTVLKNLERSFPQKSALERSKLIDEFYKHLGHIFAEGLKNLSIQKADLAKHLTYSQAHQLAEKHAQDHLILLSSHMNNWEFLIKGLSLHLPHKIVGIGKPLSKKFLDRKVNALREAHGLIVVNKNNYKERIAALEADGHKVAVLVLADQAPQPKNAFWTDFLHGETPFAFGGELLAHQYQAPTYYLKVVKTATSFYNIQAQRICENPQTLAYGEIMQFYAKLLEQHIQEEPAHWLWSHKRWKHKTPENLAEIKLKNEQFFKKRFR